MHANDRIDREDLTKAIIYQKINDGIDGGDYKQAFTYMILAKSANIDPGDNVLNKLENAVKANFNDAMKALEDICKNPKMGLFDGAQSEKDMQAFNDILTIAMKSHNDTVELFPYLLKFKQNNTLNQIIDVKNLVNKIFETNQDNNLNNDPKEWILQYGNITHPLFFQIRNLKIINPKTGKAEEPNNGNITPNEFLLKNFKNELSPTSVSKIMKSMDFRDKNDLPESNEQQARTQAEALFNQARDQVNTDPHLLPEQKKQAIQDIFNKIKKMYETNNPSVAVTQSIQMITNNPILRFEERNNTKKFTNHYKVFDETILGDLITAPGFKEIDANQPLQQLLPNEVNDIDVNSCMSNNIDILDKLKDIKSPYAFEAICNMHNFKNIDSNKMRECFNKFIELFLKPSYKDKPCLNSPEKNYSVAIEIFKQLFPHGTTRPKDQKVFLNLITEKIIQSNKALPLFTNSLVYFDCDKNNQGKRLENESLIDDYDFLKQIINNVNEDQKATFIKKLFADTTKKGRRHIQVPVLKLLMKKNFIPKDVFAREVTYFFAHPIQNEDFFSLEPDDLIQDSQQIKEQFLKDALRYLGQITTENFEENLSTLKKYCINNNVPISNFEIEMENDIMKDILFSKTIADNIDILDIKKDGNEEENSKYQQQKEETTSIYDYYNNNGMIYGLRIGNNHYDAVKIKKIKRNWLSIVNKQLDDIMLEVNNLSSKQQKNSSLFILNNRLTEQIKITKKELNNPHYYERFDIPQNKRKFIKMGISNIMGYFQTIADIYNLSVKYYHQYELTSKTKPMDPLEQNKKKITDDIKKDFKAMKENIYKFYRTNKIDTYPDINQIFDEKIKIAENKKEILLNFISTFKNKKDYQYFRETIEVKKKQIKNIFEQLKQYCENSIKQQKEEEKNIEQTIKEDIDVNQQNIIKQADKNNINAKIDNIINETKKIHANQLNIATKNIKSEKPNFIFDALQPALLATSTISTAAIPTGIFALGLNPVICAPVGAVCAIIPLIISFIRHINHKRETNISNINSEMQMYNAKFVKKPVLETNTPTEQPQQGNNLTPTKNENNSQIKSKVEINLNNKQPENHI